MTRSSGSLATVALLAWVLPYAAAQAQTAGSVPSTQPVPQGQASDARDLANPSPTKPTPPEHEEPPRQASSKGEAKGDKPKGPSETKIQSDDEQKAELEAAMKRIAQRWRARAKQEGWELHEPTPVQGQPQ